MEKAYRETALGIIVAVLIFVCGLALGFVVNRLPNAPGDAATWAGALLAGLAFAGTIWIATVEARRRHRAELVAAQLVAASMVLRLVHAEAVVSDVCRRLNIQGQVDQGLEFLVQNANLLEGIDMWEVEDLLPLAALPKIAVRLAEIGDQIRSAVKIFRRLDSQPKFTQGTERMAFSVGIHKLFVKTVESINATVIECRASADALQKSSFN